MREALKQNSLHSTFAIWCATTPRPPSHVTISDELHRSLRMRLGLIMPELCVGATSPSRNVWIEPKFSVWAEASFVKKNENANRTDRSILKMLMKDATFA